MPAIPRRRASSPLGADATSSAPRTVSTRIPSAAASSVAKSKLKNAYDSKESFGVDYFIAVPFDTDNLLLENLGFNLKTNQN